MQSVTPVGTAWQTLLTVTANDVARETGFVRRSSKQTGAQFVQAVVFGWLDAPQATLQQLAQRAGTLGVAISPPGLDQRCTPAAAQLLSRVVAAAVRHVVVTEPVAIPLLRRFGGVSLLDSSTVVLPAALAAVWPGCGGGTGPTAPPAAAVQLQVQLGLVTGLVTGLLRGPVLQDGRTHDRAAPQQTDFPAGTVRLAPHRRVSANLREAGVMERPE